MTNTHEKESHLAYQSSFFRGYFYLLGLLLSCRFVIVYIRRGETMKPLIDVKILKGYPRHAVTNL